VWWPIHEWMTALWTFFGNNAYGFKKKIAYAKSFADGHRA
jgi:hypothetical protein